jgi:hypothetical protein
MLMGYPRLFDLAGLGATCLPLVGEADAQWLDQMGDLLDNAMSTAVTEAQNKGISVSFSDPRAAFDGKAVCGNPEDIHDLVLSKTCGDDASELQSAQSFHPTIAGDAVYASVADGTLRAMGF